LQNNIEDENRGSPVPSLKKEEPNEVNFIGSDISDPIIILDDDSDGFEIDEILSAPPAGLKGEYPLVIVRVSLPFPFPRAC